MGHRTLSLRLALQALFLDGEAYDDLRDDDNPFVEGLFLVVLIGLVAAAFSLVGDVLEWASVPDLDSIKQAVLAGLQKMDWWTTMASTPQAYEGFLRSWDGAWRVLPALFGAPTPARGLANLVLWPVNALLSWLIYGTLVHVFARVFGGTGSVSQTLGTTALAFTPWLFRGLGFIPFFTVGSVLNTWQLICRYKAVRSAHRLNWQPAMWATLLPFVLYVVALLAAATISAIVASAAAGVGP